MIDVKGKKVFLSGPMSDDPKTYHAHDFIDAHIRLKDAGADEVYNPAIEWLTSNEGDQSHGYWMRQCIYELVRLSGVCSFYGVTDKPRYDLLISLPGWKGSAGATTERHVAGACGIPCVDWDEVFDEA